MTYAALIKAINSATTQLQGRAAEAINQSLVLRNWMVGAWIVEFEQTGKDRARFGQLIPYTLSTESTPRIRGTLSREFPVPLESAPLLRPCWNQLQRFLLELGRGFCLIVTWFKARMMAEGDAPPVGILLCSDKGGAEVEFATAGMDQKLFVSRYLTALPSAKRSRAFLESDRAHSESRTPLRQSIKRLPKRTHGGS